MLAVAPKPFRLPTLTRQDAERAKRVAAYREPIALPGAKGFSLAIGGGAEDTINPSELVQINAETGGIPFTMTAPRQLVHELVQALGASITVDDLPPDIGGLLLEASVASLLTLLENSTGQSIVLRGFQNLSRPPAGLPLTLNGPDRSWHLHLSCDADTLEKFLLPWPATERNLDWLPIPGRLRAGLATLDLSLLRSLRNGDVLLMDTQHDEASVLMLTVAESFCAPAAMQGASVQVLAPAVRNPKEWIMSAREQNDGDDLGNLPVRLAFDLGHIDVPLGALRQLNAGMVLELGRKPQDFVEISANGRKIGQGELVEIDGMIGVRIARILNG
jgi:type III secretion protein Q